MLRHLFLLFVLLSSLHAFEAGFTKEYYKIKDAKLKKQTFVDILIPKIHEAQKQIISDRLFIQNFFKKYLFTYSLKGRLDLGRLIKISKKYRIKQMYNEAEYLLKVDTIPISLVLAQSAVESAWGESRFAREGNNLFGEWTWGKKGMIPAGRDENAKHKLRIFDSLDDSIARYMLNLNRHHSYKDFRILRAQYRLEGKFFTGLVASTQMTNYSQMREVYNELIANVIKGNKFMSYELDQREKFHKKG